MLYRGEGLGHGAKDLAAVILPMEAIAGVEIAPGGAASRRTVPSRDA